MHRKLVELAFEKVVEDLAKDGVSSKPSLNKQTEYLAEQIDFLYSAKKLKTLYDDVSKDNHNEVNIKRQAVVKALCKYLGYPDFPGFAKDYPPPMIKGTGKGNKRRKKLILQITISVAIILVAFFSIMAIIPQKRWMEWQNTKYVEAPFDATKLKNGQLKLYREERILHFKKIKPDCGTDFFKADGKENLWYGKNEQGELEYFTDYGLHPETGSTLKAITPYMIRKYICPEY